MKTVMCAKYNEELPALIEAPFPGPDGVKIMETVSAKAWEEWLSTQTMIINEYHLNLMDPETRVKLAEARNDFLFGEDNE